MNNLPRVRRFGCRRPFVTPLLQTHFSEWNQFRWHRSWNTWKHKL